MGLLIDAYLCHVTTQNLLLPVIVDTILSSRTVIPVILEDGQLSHPCCPRGFLQRLFGMLELQASENLTGRDQFHAESYISSVQYQIFHICLKES
jgi:hypothetical protein